MYQEMFIVDQNYWAENVKAAFYKEAKQTRSLDCSRKNVDLKETCYTSCQSRLSEKSPCFLSYVY